MNLVVPGGIDCTECDIQSSCNGCLETERRPFGEECMIAAYSQMGANALKELKEALITAFNELQLVVFKRWQKVP